METRRLNRQQGAVRKQSSILVVALCGWLLAGLLAPPTMARPIARVATALAERGAPEARDTPRKKRRGKKRRGKKRRGKKRRGKKKRGRTSATTASATHRRLSPLLDAGKVPAILPPYSLKRVFRGFGKCRRGEHTHQAIDIGGVGEDAGLGTPIFAMARAKVVLIGLPQEDSRQFGKPDRGGGTVRRGYKGHLVLPKREVIPGYGRVTYFTRDYGSWRSGVVISTRGLEGPLEGHVIRYMHLGAVHPSLRRGAVVEMGEEIGLMGGTAILDSAPHVHIDITDPEGRRVDVARLLGLPQAAEPCPGH